MKKLLTSYTGGHPVKFDDFEFIQEQIRELMECTFAFLQIGKVTILSGCAASISGDGYTITIAEGYVFYNNECFYVAAHEATGNVGEVAKWIIQESYDSRGTKTFKDTSEKEVYLVRTMAVDFVDVSVVAPLYSETQYYSNSDTWHTVGDETTGLGTEYGAGFSEYSGQINPELRFRKTQDNRSVMINGSVLGDNTLSKLITTLPVGYRPATMQEFLVHYGFREVMQCKVYSTGNVSLAENLMAARYIFSAIIPLD